MEKIKLVYQGAFAIPDAEEACVVTLTDTEGGTRALSIVTISRWPIKIKVSSARQGCKTCASVDVLAEDYL